VKELEKQIRDQDLQSVPSSQLFSQDRAHPIKQEENILPEELDPLGQHGSNMKYYNWSIATRVTNQGSDQAYGASSTFYFIDRLSSYLDTVTRNLQPQRIRDSSNLATMPSSILSGLQDSFTGAETTAKDSLNLAEDLARVEEERLLKVYWNYYHAMYPILEKATFIAHYESLWTHIHPTRNPSVLVDVLLAVCMQHDAAETTSSHQKQNTPSECSPNSTCGQWFFRRSQYFLQDEIEQPTMMTFQSYALSVLWLSQASWQNAAHNTLATTLRVGVLLGLHLEPSTHLLPPIRAFRRRIWWTVYAMEAHYAMEYGRPIAVNFGQVTCGLPKDDDLLEPTSRVEPPLTSFNTQMIRLVLAHRAIYILFYRECAIVLRKNGGIDMYRDPKVGEVCAKWLEQKIGYLQAWLQHVPEGLKFPRQGLGQSYSTDWSRLNLYPADITSCRQRILLEVAYHSSAMSLYRPFILFAQISAQSCQAIEQHATSCAKHAITMTNIIHQDLTEFGSLRTWHSICSEQLNAALSLIGYIAIFPCGPAAFVAREAVDTAIQNLEIVGFIFTRAARSAITLQNVANYMDLLHTDLPTETTISQQNPQIDSEDTSTVQTAEFTTSASRRDDIHIQLEIQSCNSTLLQRPELSHFTDGLDSAEWLSTLLDIE
jgi:hypothetical protein